MRICTLANPLWPLLATETLMHARFAFLRPSALALALFAALAAPAAHAATETWSAGASSPKGVSGSVTLSFSSLMVSALNTMAWKVEANPGSTLAVSTSTNSVGTIRYTSVALSAPLTSLTGEVSNGDMSVAQVGTGLGLTFTSPRNTSNTAPGSLSLSNFSLDLAAKTVFADVWGGNGVGALSRYAVWTFGSVLGNTTVPSLASPAASYAGSFATSAIFLPTASFTDVFSRAMALSGTGRSILTSVNTPSSGGGSGFGGFGVDLTRTFTTLEPPAVLPDTNPSGITSPVPEPAGLALVLAGLGCAAVSHRRARG